MRNIKLLITALVFGFFLIPSPESRITAHAADVQSALVETFGHEGGLQCDKADPGNWTGGRVGVGRHGCTKYGIAANTYPREDIRNLTLDLAAYLYRRDFWSVMQGDRINSQILAEEIFDAGVNQGIRTAIRNAQTAVNLAYYPQPPVKVDGVMGPATLARLNGTRQDAVYVNLIDLRYGRYYAIASRNPKMMPYFRSWTIRIKNNVRKAVNEYDQWLKELEAGT